MNRSTTNTTTRGAQLVYKSARASDLIDERLSHPSTITGRTLSTASGKEGGVRKDKVNNLGSKMCRGSDVGKEGPSLPAG